MPDHESQPSQTSESIGFIGLGAVGAAMVVRLRDAGLRLTVYNRTRQKAEALAGPSVTVVDTPAQVASSAGIVFSCLDTAKADISVFLESPDSITSVPLTDVLVINLSTIGPDLSVELSDAVKARGGKYLDCALLLKNRQSPAEGTITIPIAGDKEDVERGRPVLEILGSLEHTGAVGTAQILKIVNNVQSGATAVLMAQALAIAEAAGVDHNAIRRVLPLGSARSWTMDRFLDAMLDRAYEPPSTAVSEIGEGLRLAIQLASSYGLDSSVAIAAEDTYRRARQGELGPFGKAALLEFEMRSRKP